MSTSSPSVAIVGGGVSGTLLAVQLLRNARGPLCVKIVEPREQLARGIAYSTLSKAHLLNVPAANMSALPDEPGHFLSWLRQYREPATQGYTFVPRRDYAQYVEQLLSETRRDSAPGTSIEHIRDRAARFIPTASGFDVLMEKCGPCGTNILILALGNGPAVNPISEADDLNVRNAWSHNALDGLRKDSGVLLVGSGLTAIDVCLSLIEAEHIGPVYMVSRHGLLPRAHLEVPAPPKPATAFTPRFPKTARALLREVRESVAREIEEGGSWQPVIDSIRPHTNEIWQGLAVDEKRRFMRHGRSFWEVYRHRMPTHISRKIEGMRASGQLHVICGRVVSASKDVSGEINVRILGGYPTGENIVRTARVINCTGPQNDPRKSSDPLVRQIVAEGIGRPDPLFLGLETTPDGGLIRADGSVWENIFALGPTRRGTLWETTAVPEIRRQASELARKILDRFEDRVHSA
jgi:uncharacterized NAD(P)/FAD-binding protein YdhS